MSGHNGRTQWVCFVPIGRFIVLEPGDQWCPHCTNEETGAQRKLADSTHKEPLWDGNLGSAGGCSPQWTVPRCQLTAIVIWRWLVMMICHCKRTLGFLSGRLGAITFFLRAPRASSPLLPGSILSVSTSLYNNAWASCTFLSEGSSYVWNFSQSLKNILAGAVNLLISMQCHVCFHVIIPSS